MRTAGIDVDTEHGLQVEIYNNFEQLQAMQSEWDALIQTVGAEIDYVLNATHSKTQQ